MVEILVVYHSQTGNTAKMARAVAEGVEAVDGAKVNLKHVLDADLEDLIQCDGLVVGSPEYFGYMSGLIKDFFDRTYEPARKEKAVFKKPYVVFVSAGNDGRGTVQGIERIAVGYPLKKVFDPIIARGEVTDSILDQCRELGQTIAAGCDAGIY
jgi:multimeric flavodoxin WrbA